MKNIPKLKPYQEYSEETKMECAKIISEKIKDMQSRLFSDVFSYFDRIVKEEGFKYE